MLQVLGVLQVLLKVLLPLSGLMMSLQPLTAAQGNDQTLPSSNSRRSLRRAWRWQRRRPPMPPPCLCAKPP